MKDEENEGHEKQKERRSSNSAASTPATSSILMEKSTETEKNGGKEDEQHAVEPLNDSQLCKEDPLHTMNRIGLDIVIRLKTSPGPIPVVHLTTGSEVSFIGELAASRMSHEIPLTVLKPPRRCKISLDGVDFPIHDIKYSMRVTFLVGQLSFKEDLFVVSRIHAPHYGLNRINLGCQLLKRVVRLIDTNSNRITFGVGDRQEALHYELQRPPKPPADWHVDSVHHLSRPILKH